MVLLKSQYYASEKKKKKEKLYSKIMKSPLSFIGYFANPP